MDLNSLQFVGVFPGHCPSDALLNFNPQQMLSFFERSMTNLTLESVQLEDFLLTV